MEKILVKNFSSNFISKILNWTASLFAIPFYANAMGSSNYGIIGIYTVILGIVATLDLGMSAAINNRISKSGVNQFATARDIFYNYERLYFLVAAGVIVCGLISAGPISIFWLQFDDLNKEPIAFCVGASIATAAFRLPMFLYLGILRGLEYQFLESKLSVSVTIARLSLSVVAVSVFPESPLIFICVQFFIGIGEVALYRSSVKRLIAGIHSSGMNGGGLLLAASGFAVITMLMGFVAGGERIVASKMLSAREMAAISIAYSCSSAFAVASGALGTALFPRFSNLAVELRFDEIRQVIKKGIMAIFCANFIIYIGLIFSLPSILKLFLRDDTLAADASKIFRLVGLSVCITTLQDVFFVHHMALNAYRKLILNAVVVLLSTYFGSCLFISHLGLEGVGAAGVICAGFSLLYLGISSVLVLKQPRGFFNSV